MRRVISVWLPQWPIDRGYGKKPGRQPDDSHRLKERPFALIASGRSGLFLYAVNHGAAALGLAQGMALADARALVPELATRPAALDADATALRQLADWCGQFSPWVNVDGADGLWLDISGCGHLFGGEDKLMEQLVRQLGDLGLTARAGLADTPGAAWGLARYGSGMDILAAGQIAEGLSPLPVEALRIDGASALLLRRLGLATIGALYRLPRAGLKRRFPSRAAGENLLKRLDQALGRVGEPLSPLNAPALYRSRVVLADPVQTRAAIDHLLEALMEKLCAHLAGDAMGARALTLAAYRIDGRVERVSVALSRPSREIAHFRRLFAEKLDAIDPGFGIEVMILGADVVEALALRQLDLTAQGAGPSGGLDQLVDRLTNRLGSANILRLAPRASHLPERAQKRLSALNPAIGWPQDLPGVARPHRLLTRPERIEVMAEIPEGPPLRFSWRRIVHQVARAEGPERIAPEWWRLAGAGPARTRDYYRVEDVKGRRFWIFRQGLYAHAGSRHNVQGSLPQWYLHGFFA